MDLAHMIMSDPTPWLPKRNATRVGSLRPRKKCEGCPMRNARLWWAWVIFLGGSVALVLYMVVLFGHVAAQNSGTVPKTLPVITCLDCKQPALVPFDVPPKETRKPYTLGIYPPPHELTVYADGHGHEWTVEFHCDDTKRVLLTDEAGNRHCFSFYVLGDSH